MRLQLTRFRPIKFVWDSLRDPLMKRVGWGRLISMWCRGFSTNQIVLFGLNESNWQDYPREAFRYLITMSTNQGVWQVLHDKLWFDGFMKGRLPYVEAVFLVEGGRFCEIEKDYDIERFIEAVFSGESFVIKPGRGGMGRGLIFVSAKKGQVEVNGRACSPQELRVLVSQLDYHLCYPLVECHEVLKALYPPSFNTLRVTAYVGQDGRPALACPVLRVGSSKSAPIDNFCRGGLLIEIDDETGICIRALRRNEEGRVEFLTHHPESGVAMTGLKVPFWKEVRRNLLAFHEACPAFDLVGWDVLIGEDGYQVIEGNHNPDLSLPMLFRNLSKETALRGFLERRGVMKRREYPDIDEPPP